MQAEFPFTQTYAELPPLLYVDYVWDEASKEEWFKQSHSDRLDRLNARACALDLNAVTMPITFIYETDNNDNLRISEGFAPVTLTYNSSGYTYLGFTEDMKSHMQRGEAIGRGHYWEAPKDLLKQFKMMSGPVVAARLQSMYREVRPETLFFLSSLIDEAIKGHNEWVSNGGYTIEGDKDLGPALAKKVKAVVREQSLQDIISRWSVKKQAALQRYMDVMETGSVMALSRFIVLDEGWNHDLSQEEKAIASELWELENENDSQGNEAGGETDAHAET